MKTKLLLTALVLVLLSTINHQLSTTFAQGPLSPPGTPAPAMKTLAQIEPRTPISAPFSITTPGAYYLTTNIFAGNGVDGIDIKTNDVTLDLNGFTIFSATNGSTTGIGIWQDTLSDITICNGHIAGYVTNNAGVFGGNGFTYGIVYYGDITPSPPNFVISHVTVTGCSDTGIYAGIASSSLVEFCSVQDVGGVGIYANNVSQCAAVQCGGDAIQANNVSASTGSAFGSSDGISAQFNAQNCNGISSGNGIGLFATQAANCSGTSASGDGISASGTVVNCYGYSTSATGIYTSVAQNCTGSSQGNAPGIVATCAQNSFGTSSSGIGVYGASLMNCYGSSTSGYGIYAFGIGIGCYGATSSGTAVDVIIGNSCYGTPEIVTYKYNMP